MRFRAWLAGWLREAELLAWVAAAVNVVVVVGRLVMTGRLGGDVWVLVQAGLVLVPLWRLLLWVGLL